MGSRAAAAAAPAAPPTCSQGEGGWGDALGGWGHPGGPEEMRALLSQQAAQHRLLCLPSPEQTGLLGSGPGCSAGGTPGPPPRPSGHPAALAAQHPLRLHCGGGHSTRNLWTVATLAPARSASSGHPTQLVARPAAGRRMRRVPIRKQPSQEQVPEPEPRLSALWWPEQSCRWRPLPGAALPWQRRPAWAASSLKGA